MINDFNLNYPGKKNQIAGVVILYNPDEKVFDNIQSYIEQVEVLFVFDNSDKDNSVFSERIKKHLKCFYQSNGKNLGVGKVLNLAAAKAVMLGYSFLLTMDQDSKASPGMVMNLIEAAVNIPNAGIISPYHHNKISTHIVPEVNIEDKLVVMTSGNLLNLEAYEKIGPFMEEFFIDYVDTEYCMRLKKNNYRVIRVNSVPIFHNEADVSKRKIFGKEFYPYNHAPKRLYFKVRNRFYLRDMYKTIFPNYFEYEYPLFRNMLIKSLLFEKDRIKKLRYAVKGFIDYNRGVKFSPFDN